MTCKVLFDLPPKEPLKWRSDYKSPTSCYVCYGTEDLRGWPRLMCSDPPPWTCICKHCVIAWYENGGVTVEALRETRLKDMQNEHSKKRNP
jgi:hypothetical protein